MENVRNESSETVEILVKTFATLTEQTTLLLGQALLSVCYARHLNIFEALVQDYHKAKTLLEEKAATLQVRESHVFGKKSLATHN